MNRKVSSQQCEIGVLNFISVQKLNQQQKKNYDIKVFTETNVKPRVIENKKKTKKKRIFKFQVLILKSL